MGPLGRPRAASAGSCEEALSEEGGGRARFCPLLEMSHRPLSKVRATAPVRCRERARPGPGTGSSASSLGGTVGVYPSFEPQHLNLYNGGDKPS